MRGKRFLASFVIVLVFFVPPAFAKTISSIELIEKCQFYDGKEVAYQGEVIGDIMIRGENAWINLNDDSYNSKKTGETFKLKGYNTGQSIWCKASQVKFIKYKGDYKNSGDIVQVKGIFHRACAEHGGDMDIHANELIVLKEGRIIEHSIDRGKVLILLFLALLIVVLFIARILTLSRPATS